MMGLGFGPEPTILTAVLPWEKLRPPKAETTPPSVLRHCGVRDPDVLLPDGVAPPTQGSKPIEQMGKLSPKGAVTAPSCSETEHGCNPHKCFISYGPIYFPETGPLKNLGVSVGSFRFPGEL